MYKKVLTEYRYSSQGHCSRYHITHSIEAGTVCSFTVKEAVSFDSERSNLAVNPLELKWGLGHKTLLSAMVRKANLSPK